VDADPGRDRGHGAWQALPPHVTYRPPPTQSDVVPSTLRDATLSGVVTQAEAQGLRATAPDPKDSAKPPPPVLPGFELVEEIGRGGMGVVFRAHQRSLARDIAIKLIRPEAGGDLTKNLFVSEALVNGLLDHPNIVPVHELGSSERGEVFLAMKLVGGTSWKDLLHPATQEHRRLAKEVDLDRHLAILTAVGNAVAFAHSKGIVHRDLKPENVMVGEFGEVLVMDWGIAVDVRPVAGSDARTRHKSTITAPSGTPSYMPPELAEGRGADLGPATDTYLLGAILHEVLTGHPPHRGATLLAVLLAASKSAAPTFPAGTPPGLARICTKALAKDPKDRYGTVAEFQAAIRDFTRHRDSQKVAESAAIALGRAEAGGVRDEAARTRRYGHYADAIAGFRQALGLWPDNPEAKDGERKARLEFANAALEANDVVLADAQLEVLASGDAQAVTLRQRVAEVRAARAKARTLARNLRRGVIAGTAVVVLGLAAGLLLLSREQLRNANALLSRGEQESALKAKLAVVAADPVARSAVHGASEPELTLLAEGSAGAPSASELATAFPEVPSGTRALGWSPATGRLLVATAGDDSLEVFVPLGPANRPRMAAPSGGIACAALSENGRFAAAANAAGAVLVWEVESEAARLLHELTLGGPVERLAVDDAGRELAASIGSTARLWNTVTKARTGGEIDAGKNITRLCFRAGSIMVVAKDASATQVWRCDPATAAVTRRVVVTVAR